MKKHIKTITFYACLAIISATVHVLLTKTMKGKKLRDDYRNGRYYNVSLF